MNLEEIKAREQAATVKIDRSREDLVKLDVLGESALKSAKLMDLIVNGATLMSVNKDTLRGIIRVIITGAAAEVEWLTDQHQCDAHNLAAMQATFDQQAKSCEKLLTDDKQQIATLKKALKVAIDRALPNSSYSVKQVITRNLLEECAQQLTHETHGEANHEKET